MKEKWGISGSHGFIGSHLKDKLEQDGYQVEIISRTGYIPDVDIICDLAAYGNMYGQNDSVEIYRANVLRVVDMLENRRGAKVIILTSTSSVDLPVKTLYSASKKAVEEIAEIYIREKNVPIFIVRPCSVYGIGEQKEHLIPKLIDSCLNGTEIPFVGEPVHDWIYIDDFINEYLNIAGLREKGAIWTIGTGILTTNKEVKDIVERITGKKANLKRVDSMRSYDTKDWPTGAGGTTTLEEGIRRMIDAYR